MRELQTMIAANPYYGYLYSTFSQDLIDSYWKEGMYLIRKCITVIGNIEGKYINDGFENFLLNTNSTV